MQTPSLPHGLQDLLPLSNCQQIRCLGRYCPVQTPCTRQIRRDDEHFQRALHGLERLLKGGIQHYGAGLIDMLTLIARGFSCTRHRSKPQIAHLPYYWLTLSNLPEFSICMGLETSVESTAEADRRNRIQLIIDKLDPERLYYLDNALGRLGKQWWRKEGKRAIAEYFKAALEQRRIAVGDSVGDAQQRWQTWHQHLETVDLTADMLTDSSLVEDISGIECSPPDSPVLQEFLYDGRKVTPVPAGLSSKLNVDKSSILGQFPIGQDSNFEGSAAHDSPSTPERPPLLFTSPSAPEVMRTPAQYDGTAGAKRTRTASLSAKYSRTGALISSDDEETDSTGHSIGEKRRKLLHCASESHTSQAIKTPHAIEFEVYQKPKPVMEVTCDVFNEMQKPLTDKADEKGRQNDSGYVYAFRLLDRPGFIKIGRTKKDISKRQKRIQRCAGGELVLLDQRDFCSVPNHCRVEALIHTTLQPYRRTFKCNCKARRRRSDHDSEATMIHGEWFEINEEKATKTIDMWRKWMDKSPYSNRKLQWMEETRIRYYDKLDTKTLLIRKADVENEHDSWDWEAFLHFPAFRLCLIELRGHFCEERPQRNDISSRLVSLLKHLVPNLILFSCFLIFSTVTAFIQALLPSTWLSLISIALVNGAFLGAIAIWYAS